MTCSYCGSMDHARHCPRCGRGIAERCAECDSRKRAEDEPDEPGTYVMHMRVEPHEAWHRGGVDAWLSLPEVDR